MIGMGGEEAVVAASRVMAQADEKPASVAGLVDEEGLCVNAILVHIDTATGAAIDYTPPEGLRLIVNDGAGVGKIWNGSEFIDRKVDPAAADEIAAK